MSFPKSLENLVEQLKVLPGVGRKTAERYALHIINKLDQEQSNQIADAIQVAKNKIKHCSICGNLTDDDVCDICQSNSRDEST
ncbi:MAG: recombination protein RecR, partial [Candidatus Izemoplasmatales bacterium]|nr:recombination protein RecR [Candidatus Izemoplasmatales bacterium]